MAAESNEVPISIISNDILQKSLPSIPSDNDSVSNNNSLQNILLEIKKKKELLNHLNDELSTLQRKNQDLTDQFQHAQDRLQMRQKEQQSFIDNYTQHIRSQRATDDNPHTIHKKLLDLKFLIKQLSATWAQQCDPVIATASLCSFWINLPDAIAALGQPLPKQRIEMLTEKFLMDVLVQTMNYNVFSGLRISSAYSKLQKWFDHYDATFCTRLRQEVARVAVMGNTPDSDISRDVYKFNKRMYTSLYTSLKKPFPFMDAYTTPLMNLVELASHIGYAIRGQEVEIAAVAVGEGSEPIDLNTMVDEDDQTSGTIQFCISPPFIVYGKSIKVLEKARVLCL